MDGKLLTSYASIDGARARSFLEEAKGDAQRSREVYEDCFFEGSVAAAEAAVQFALKVTDSTKKAIELADVLKSLPTAIPVRTAKPLAQLSAFLALKFADAACRAPLNTFCYAEKVVKRTALKTTFERLRDVVWANNANVSELLDRVKFFIEDINDGSEEADRHIIVERLIGIATGTNDHVRDIVFKFLLQLHTIPSPWKFSTENECDSEDYESYLLSQLASLANTTEGAHLLVLRSLEKSLELGTVSSLLTLWTSHRALVTGAVSTIGRDSFLYLILANAARLACSGNMSDCHTVVHIARHVLGNKNETSSCMNNVVSIILVAICASIGATSSACGAEDLSKLVAEILHLLRITQPDESSVDTVLRKVRFAMLQSQTWNCPGTVATLGLLLKVIELWKEASLLREWLYKDLSVMSNTEAVASHGGGEESSIAATSNSLRAEESRDCSREHSESLLPLIALLGVAILSHPAPTVRAAAVDFLRNVTNSKAILFCFPAVLMRLQFESNGVVALKIIRCFLTSPSLLRENDTSNIALNACIHSLGNSNSAAGRNSATYQAAIVALGYATQSAPGSATSLLLTEVEKLNKGFGLTPGPTRAAAAAAILKLVESRPTRGTGFIPFISQCIAPESMAVVPEASSLCFAAMSVMAEEEVLDPVKAVRIVVKNYKDVLDVEPQARKSYLKLLGSVAKGSSSKRGAILGEKVVKLLRRCLKVLHPNEHDQVAPSQAYLSWKEIGQAAQSLGQFSVDEILERAFGKEELQDIQSESERKEMAERNCQDFIQEILSITAHAHCVEVDSSNRLQSMLVKIVSHEWENRQRSSFDPDRIAKLRAASDALRRARQAKESIESETVRGIKDFARAVNGLPAGVIKGIYEECIWNAHNEGDGECSQSFWVSLRVILAAKALSRALPWVGLVAEVMMSDTTGEGRASCLAVFRAAQDDSFELKDARAKWFGALSPLFDSSIVTSMVERKELFVGMVHFFPTEVVRLLFKFKDVTSLTTTHALIRASRELSDQDVQVAAKGLFPVVLRSSDGQDHELCESLEREFYESILTKCERAFVEELLLSNITETSSIRIACMFRSYDLLRHAGRVAIGSAESKYLLEIIGRTMKHFDASHRREFVIDLCPSTDDPETRERQLWLAVHVFGVAALLPATELALSTAVCFCERADREAVARTINAIVR